VRKPSKEKDVQEETIGCCQCQALGGAYELNCQVCQSSLPFCIATGKRLSASDAWTQCPHCHFAANLAALQAYTASSGKCPLCEAALDAAALRMINRQAL
jgi:hypothetical protein